MPQIIEVPGMGAVEFPDGMSDEQIVSAIQANTGGATGAWGRGASGSFGPPTSEYDPAAGMSAAEKYAAGAGSQVMAFGRGVRDLGINAALARNPMQSNRSAVDEQMRQAEDERRRLDAPLLSTKEGSLGAIGGAVGTALPAMLIPGGQTVGGGALVGGALGLLQPVGSEDSRVSNTAVGAAFGGLTPAALNVAGRVARPVRNALNPEGRAAVEGLKEAGVPLSVAQQTGSRAAQAVERTLADNPVTAPAMGQQLAKRVRAFTRSAMRTVGEDVDTASPTALNAARTRIGSVMDDIESKYALKATPKAIKELADIEAEAARVLPDGGKQIQAQIENIRRIAAENGGAIPGKSARLIRSELQKVAAQPGAGEYAMKLREVIDDATQRAAQGTDDFARYQKARAQYRNLKAIENAVADDGTISAARLAQRLKSGKHTRNSYRYGTGDAELSTLARNMSMVLDRFPNSGTASRVGQQLALPGALAAGSALMGGDMQDAAKWAAVGWGGPKLAAALMNNPATANYLANGIGREIPQNALIDLMRRSGQLAGPALLASHAGN